MISERESVQLVVEGALALAGADKQLLDGEIREARLPVESRSAFGNRGIVRYTFDRSVRQYHPDVEYAAVGSALVAQAIQAIRERSTVVVARPPLGRSDEDLLRGLVDPGLELSSVVRDALPPRLYARAQVSVTMVSDDRRTFLRELIVPLAPGDRGDGQTRGLLAAADAIDGDLTDVEIDIAALLDQVLARAERSVKADIDLRESELEARLQDALQRLGAGPMVEAMRREFQLRVQIDVAYLEIVRLERQRLRGLLVDRTSRVTVPIVLETYQHELPGVVPVATCSSCQGPAARLTICAEGGGHVVCMACSLRCAGCGNRRCRQHPVTGCNSPDCHRSFCGSCLAACSDCGRGACISHRTECSQCSGTACDTCTSQCAFHAEGLHRSHLQDCRICGVQACDSHRSVCRFDGAGSAPVCEEHLVRCVVEGHDELVCIEHGGACVACARPACPEHAKQCADCGRRGCSEDASECELGSEWTLRVHQRACQACGASACGNHLGTCVSCDRLLCSRHLRSCSAGGHVVCDEDWSSCSECGEVACADHREECVGGGTHQVCARDRCRVRCSDGGEVVCRAHALVCDAGSESVCPSHVHRCHIGNERMCEVHSSNCEICARPFCGEHHGTCAICGRVPICAACAGVELPGEPEHICTACASATMADGGELGDVSALRRPFIERLVDRRPTIARSRSVIALTSVLPFGATVHTHQLDGRLLGTRRIPRRLGVALRRLVDERRRESTGDQSRL